MCGGQTPRNPHERNPITVVPNLWREERESQGTRRNKTQSSTPMDTTSHHQVSKVCAKQPAPGPRSPWRGPSCREFLVRKQDRAARRLQPCDHPPAWFLLTPRARKDGDPCIPPGLLAKPAPHRAKLSIPEAWAQCHSLDVPESLGPPLLDGLLVPTRDALRLALLGTPTEQHDFCCAGRAALRSFPRSRGVTAVLGLPMDVPQTMSTHHAALRMISTPW